MPPTQQSQLAREGTKRRHDLTMAIDVLMLSALMCGLRSPVPHGSVLGCQSAHPRYCALNCLKRAPTNTNVFTRVSDLAEILTSSVSGFVWFDGCPDPHRPHVDPSRSQPVLISTQSDQIWPLNQLQSSQ